MTNSAPNALGFELHDLTGSWESAKDGLDRDHVIRRMWSKDHTLWQPEPTDVTNRLGWLDAPATMMARVSELQSVAERAREAGLTKALLIGMGGSSLAPEMFSKIFGSSPAGLDLAVADSTDPRAVLSQTSDLEKTLWVVATKSGGTVETLSLFKHFYRHAQEALGQEAPTRFVAITDPGSKLEKIAQKLGFFDVVHGDPGIGGRFSALSPFGLLPAALLGMDVPALLDRAQAMQNQHGPDVALGPGAELGAALAVAAQAGIDKLTVLLPPELESFGDWVEQLVAESTGKGGQGILPVVGETLGSPEVYGQDRLLVSITWQGNPRPPKLQALVEAGHPLVELNVADRYDLGGHVYLWAMATAVAGHLLELNPFNQPNVESAKVLARKMVAAYSDEGALPAQEPAFVDQNGIEVFGDIPHASHAGAALCGFVESAESPAYVAIQAYLPPTDETTKALQTLRSALRDRYKLAVTLGYGPRFLHSTGQLHKGDNGRGLFVQMTAPDSDDVPIPDEPGSRSSNLTFGVLKNAQAMGDRQALIDGGRRVVRFGLTESIAKDVEHLTSGLVR